MEQKRALVVTIITSLLVLAVIIGVVFYLIKFFQGRSATRTSPRPSVIASSPLPSTNPIIQGTSGSVQQTPTPVVNGKKTYQGQGFKLTYPANWGLLTCNNSRNIEFDPYNSNDQLKVTCNYAVKPITVIVGSTNCVPQTAVQTAVSINYRWCTNTNPVLDITHRVSDQGAPASSKDNFSNQIEEMIRTVVN